MSLKTGAMVLLVFGALLFSIGFSIEQDYQEWEDDRSAMKSQCIQGTFDWSRCDYIDNLENPNDSGSLYINGGGVMLIVGMVILLYDEWDLT